MKAALKYGSLITAVIAVWVLADHAFLHTNTPGSRTAFLTPVVFNVVSLFFLFLGISELRRENNGKLTIGDGIKRGLSISLVYALLGCLFFLVAYLIVGSKLLENESQSFGNQRPESYVLLGAFAGLFFAAIVGGLLFSAIISVLLKGAKGGRKV